MSRAFNTAFQIVSSKTTPKNRDAKEARLTELEKTMNAEERSRMKDLWEAFYIDVAINAPLVSEQDQ